MSDDQVDRDEVEELRRRLSALRDAATLLARHGVPAADGALDVDTLVARATERLRHGTDHTVVALVGSTGSGKSSLLNALTGEDVARTGVTRPTTAITQAVTFGKPADGLLDHLEVTRRHHLPDAGSLHGLVLLYLPDFDSVAVQHRMEVDRLIGLVDLMAWVTDPQKYADEALHDGYLRPLSSHAEVMLVVLNKIDTVGADAAAKCLDDLSRLLVADGLTGVTPLGTSTTTGEGLDGLRGTLAAEVAARAAAVERIAADVNAAANALRERSGGAGAADLARLKKVATEGLAGAAGVGGNALVVAEQYRRDAVLAVGWPPLRVIRRFRRAPLERLATSGESPIARSEVNRTLRATAELVEGDGAVSGWGRAAAATVRDRTEPVVAALDTQTTRQIQVLRQAPRWWGALRRLHGLWLIALVVGVLWLVGLAAAEAFLLIDVEQFVPRWRGIALPTALAGIGVVGGWLTALIGRGLARVGAGRQAKRARAALTEKVAVVVDEQLIDPLGTLLADAREAEALLDRATG